MISACHLFIICFFGLPCLLSIVQVLTPSQRLEPKNAIQEQLAEQLRLNTELMDVCFLLPQRNCPNCMNFHNTLMRMRDYVSETKDLLKVPYPGWAKEKTGMLVYGATLHTDLATAAKQHARCVC
jgi:hypothetical protein